MLGLAVALTTVVGCTPPQGSPAASESPSAAVEMSTPDATPTPTPAAEPTATPTPDALPLSGVVVVVDPGHQLGNRNFPREITTAVDAGNGATKDCNTTGTATDDDVPEATVTWEVSEIVVARLRERGAEVVLTRESNSDEEWGPCIDVRGSLANDRADLLLSIHADGAPAQAHGFHVLLPEEGSDHYDESLRLGQGVLAALDGAGIDRATYVAGAMRASDDYATLNHSAKPAVIVELGNMRHDGDAELLTGPDGQVAYAEALAVAVETFVAGATG
ncbi:N-acetylmuramoyl-L-alanine amidase [Serinibacter arcticus]|uniref:N-acetylmuramoyl-L-alanine amidase n=1 Tax=Serinibacter arcticus TaxID=1655435 RepID=A0A2U1ZXR1_9MICO|nr:N-acetylmuramoyl-L-alanine amidase [Serinibacter arcticus]